MKEELYDILKDTSEYKLFKKNSRVRSICVGNLFRTANISNNIFIKVCV